MLKFNYCNFLFWERWKRNDSYRFFVVVYCLTLKRLKVNEVHSVVTIFALDFCMKLQIAENVSQDFVQKYWTMGFHYRIMIFTSGIVIKLQPTLDAVNVEWVEVIAQSAPISEEDGFNSIIYLCKHLWTGSRRIHNENRRHKNKTPSIIAELIIQH